MANNVDTDETAQLMSCVICNLKSLNFVRGCFQVMNKIFDQGYS